MKTPRKSAVAPKLGGVFALTSPEAAERPGEGAEPEAPRSAPKAPEAVSGLVVPPRVAERRSVARGGPEVPFAGVDAEVYSADGREDVAAVLACPVICWGAMGAITVVCEIRGQVWFLTSSKSAYAKALDDGVPCVLGGELKCIAIAVEHGRMRSRDFVRGIERKLRNARSRFTPDVCFDGAAPVDPARCGISVGDVFDALGVRVIATRGEATCEAHETPMDVMNRCEECEAGK